MIVGYYYACRVVIERALNYGARVDYGFIYRSRMYYFRGYQPVGVVKKKGVEFFVGQVLEREFKIVYHRFRRGKQVSPAHLVRAEACGNILYKRKQERAVGRHSLYGLQIARFQSENIPEASVAFYYILCKYFGVPAGNAVEEKKFENFVILPAAQPLFEVTFPDSVAMASVMRRCNLIIGHRVLPVRAIAFFLPETAWPQASCLLPFWNACVSAGGFFLFVVVLRFFYPGQGLRCGRQEFAVQGIG